MTGKKTCKIKVLHLITGLNTGGAEMMLYKLLTHLDRRVIEAEVVSLMDIGPTGQKIQQLGIPVRALGMRRGLPNPLGVLQLACWLRQDPPHVIQTWMYHADLIGGLVARLAGSVPVVWGIRHSNLDPVSDKRRTIWTARTCARFSRRLPARIVCCSWASRRAHTELGYQAEKMVVIPNGFDLNTFRPDPPARQVVRRELGIPKNALLIGLVGRFNPAKGHRNFIYAATRLYNSHPNVYFLLCGDNVTRENPELAEWLEAAGISSRYHLLGRREDIPRLTASLDIASSTSSSEGFPNVVGEAMASGVPCVVTDVGDSPRIVGDTGRVVPPGDPQALAEAWRGLIEIGPEGRNRLGLAARRRVEEYFNLPFIATQYEGLYREVAADVRPDRLS